MKNAADFQKPSALLPAAPPRRDAAALLASFRADAKLMARLRDLGVAEAEMERYLPILLTYQENEKACESCADGAACPRETPHFRMVLELADSGRLSFHLEECQWARERRRLIENYWCRDFPDAWLGASLKSFRTAREKELKRVIAAAVSKRSLRHWAYLHGEQGTGKSYALAAFTNDFAKLGRKVAYLNATKRFDELKGLAIKDGAAFTAAMDALSAVDLLVIDDFGSEYKSDYVRDQIVMPLLLARAKNRAAITLFASDYSLGEIESLYGFRYGAQVIARRLAETIRKNLNPLPDVAPEGAYEVRAGLENFARR